MDSVKPCFTTWLNTKGLLMSELEKKWAEAEKKAPKEPVVEPELEKPQVVYGIHIMWMSDGNPHAEITGNPSTAEVYRLVQEVYNNLQADIIAHKVKELIVRR
jgi:hypothetical protein